MVPSSTQGPAPDEADVDAQAAVLAAALEAHEDAIADARPLGVLGVTVHAHLENQGIEEGVSREPAVPAQVKRAPIGAGAPCRGSSRACFTLLSAFCCNPRSRVSELDEAMDLQWEGHGQAASRGSLAI